MPQVLQLRLLKKADPRCNLHLSIPQSNQAKKSPFNGEVYLSVHEACPKIVVIGHNWTKLLTGARLANYVLGEVFLRCLVGMGQGKQTTKASLSCIHHLRFLCPQIPPLACDQHTQKPSHTIQKGLSLRAHGTRLLLQQNHSATRTQHGPLPQDSTKTMITSLLAPLT